MEKDEDLKLYNEYINGSKEAFEEIYTKYKSKIQYFIYNIIKDMQKAEDITQEVFIYILKNRIPEYYSFKYYIFLVAKSRAINYINVEKRREEITKNYIVNEKTEEDVLETLTRKETQKEVLEAINMLDDKYKIVMFLVKIEEFSYREVANMLGETVQNIKNLVHRGKKELKKILIKKGEYNMSKSLKILTMIICISVVLSGFVYATIKIYKNVTEKAKLTPVFTGEMGNNDYNSIWVGTFNLAWNELMNQFVNGEVEFEEGNTELVDELNKQTFKKEQLSEEDYYIKVGKTTPKLKEEILQDIKEKFNIDNSSLLKDLNFEPLTEKDFTIYTMIYKDFEFCNPFDKLDSRKFKESEEKVKFFGIDNESSEFLNSNVEILFFNSQEDFAIKLRTKANEEILLYRTEGNKSFNEYYEEIVTKKSNYKGRTQFGKNDELRIPYINVNEVINYNELCGKNIKGTNGMFLQKAMQNVKFILNENGGNMTSEAVIMGSYNSYPEENEPIVFNFDDTFVLFMKEKNKDQAYMSLKVDNIDILELATEK